MSNEILNELPGKDHKNNLCTYQRLLVDSDLIAGGPSDKATFPQPAGGKEAEVNFYDLHKGPSWTSLMTVLYEKDWTPVFTRQRGTEQDISRLIGKDHKDEYIYGQKHGKETITHNGETVKNGSPEFIRVKAEMN